MEDVVKFLTKNVIDKQGTMTEFGMATSEAREKAQRFLDVRSLGLSPETTVEINGSIGHLEEEIGVLGLLNSSENGMNRDPKRITMPSGCPDILKPFYERLQAVYDSEAGKECYGLFDENEGINEVMKRLESMGFAAFHQQYSDPLTHQKASETMRRVRKNIRLAYVKPEEAENTFDGASVVKKEWTRGMEWILVPDDLPEGARIVRVTAKGESWWEAVYFKLQETEPVERS